MKRMKKAISLLAAAVMVFALAVPVNAAGETGVATEEQLVAALENGGTIQVTADIDLKSGLTVGSGVTVVLDLNGHTISQTKEQTGGHQMILNDGNLTINDSKGGGKLSYTDSGNGGEYISDTIYNRSVLVINGGTIENLSSSTVASNGYPHAVDTYSGIRDTSTTVNGGTIYCAEYSAMRMFCVSATHKADLVINDGTIKGAVDMQNGTKVSAIGTLTVNGGTFETTKNVNNIRFANWNGGATEYGITATIKDGNFNGGFNTKYVPAAANWNSKIITGGTFAKDLSAFVVEGYDYVEQADGSYIVCNHANTTVTDAAVAPTCTATGLKAGSHCSACGKVIVAQETVAALGHTEVVDKAVAATCTETGLTEGKHCSVCKEVLVAQKEVAALGHDYVKGVCSVCKSIVEVVGDTTDSVVKEEVIEKNEVVVEEVTIIQDTNTTAAKESVKAEANAVVSDVVKEVIVAEKEVAELEIVKDEVISKETAENIVKAIEAGETEFVTEIVVEAADEKLVEKSVAKDIEKKAEATLGADAKIAQYLDVSVLLKTASTDKVMGTIDKLEKEITVTIAIPEELKADGRTYIVIREHNGVIENIPTVVNKDGTISFKTGKFSTYALAYTDEGVSAPKTGDTPVAAPIAGICVAGIVVVAAMTRRKSIIR